MHTRRFFQLFCVLTGLHSGLFAQVSFANRTDLLPPGKHFSGVALAVFDWNGDGHDDIVRMNYGYLLSVEYQTAPNAHFRHAPGIPFINRGSQSGMCAGDLDNDGIPEMLTAGTYGNVIRLLPPLVISDELLSEGLDVMTDALASALG